MTAERELHYFCRPTGPCEAGRPVSFLPVHEFLADEPACRALWDLISTQFRTRGKFLTVWPSVRFVAVHRRDDGRADGFLHYRAVCLLGIAFGELFVLDELAADCAADGVFDGLFTAAPLNKIGGSVDTFSNQQNQLVGSVVPFP